MDNWVIIPCHNNSALLIEGLKSIIAQTIPVRILAINNGSADNVPFVLNGLGDQHVVTNAYPQLGVAGAWNMGLNLIFKDYKAEKALIVNQDVVLRPDTYEVLNNEGEDFVTAVSTTDIRTLQLSNLSDLSQRERSQGRRPHPDFSCFLLSKRCYERVGPFDAEFYPAWFEDNDYHIRTARAGIEACCIDLPFYHYASGTMKNASEYDKANYYGPGFLKSKERFQAKWGCLPGTKEYEEMCSTAYWAHHAGQ